jgi:hypothetical protein
VRVRPSAAADAEAADRKRRREIMMFLPRQWIGALAESDFGEQEPE